MVAHTECMRRTVDLLDRLGNRAKIFRWAKAAVQADTQLINDTEISLN